MGKAQKKKLQSYLKDIERGKFQGMLTDFVIAEAIGALMRAASTAEGRELSPTDRILIEETIEELVDDLGLIVHGSDVLAGPPNEPADVFATIRNLIASTTPVKYHRKWRHFGGADALHLLFAHRAGADCIATFDQDFRSATQPVVPFFIEEEY